MSQHQARDDCIWNRLFHGNPRIPVQIDSDDELVYEQHNEKHYSDFDSKCENCDIEEPIIVKENRYKNRTFRSIILVILILGFYSILKYGELFSTIINPGCRHQHSLIANILDESTNSISTLNANGTSRQVIGVSNPFVVHHEYGESVYSSRLVKHTFGNSWGSPAIGNFKPPSDSKFNRVVLTLNTSSSGVQYDRLANMFIDNVEVWRTSTAEPGNSSFTSTAKKDVSKYLSLFTHESKILFQLDNIIGGRLNGKFDIELFADFYYVEEEDDHQVFSVARPASQVYPLVHNNDNNTAPIRYLPSDKIHINLPKISMNTTRLGLSIFTSGNAAEEFWYANVLDKYVDKFEKYGKALQGHGPVRIVNVYLNGRKIATQSPQPVIFSGGLSPALWSSVVSINAFDISSIDLDVSGLLPLLWEGVSEEDQFLEIEVSNGISETDKSQSRIGENWITAANLLAYESKDVVSASGDILKIDHDEQMRITDFAPPHSGTFQQIITGSFNAELTSNLNFALRNGTLLNTTISSSSEAKISNIQSYYHFGDSQKLVHVGASTKSFTILDNDKANDNDNELGNKIPSNVIHHYETSLNYSLTISLNQNGRSGPDDTDFEYNVKIVNAKDARVHVDGQKVMSESSFQKGDSTYTLSHKGNHGFGTLFTKYKLDIHKPSGDLQYQRTVIARNGTIAVDKTRTGNVKYRGRFQLQYYGSPKHLQRKMRKHGVSDSFGEFLEVLFDLSQIKTMDVRMVNGIRDILNQIDIYNVRLEFFVARDDVDGVYKATPKYRHHKGIHHKVDFVEGKNDFKDEHENGKHHEDKHPEGKKHHRVFKGKNDFKDEHENGRHHEGKHPEGKQHHRVEFFKGKNDFKDEHENGRHHGGKHHEGDHNVETFEGKNDFNDEHDDGRHHEGKHHKADFVEGKSDKYFRQKWRNALNRLKYQNQKGHKENLFKNKLSEDKHD